MKIAIFFPFRFIAKLLKRIFKKSIYLKKHKSTLIDKHSIFYKIPIEVIKKELLILDSIRFTIELIDLNYNNLVGELKNATLNHGIANSKYQKDLALMFNHCWSIIDNTQRFIKLIQLLPSENNHRFINRIKHVTNFRHTFQHIDERIEKCFIVNDMPIYGEISWEFNSDSTNKFYARTGIHIPGSSKILINTDTINIPKNEIMNIKLETCLRFGKRTNYQFKKEILNISEFMKTLKNIIKNIESDLTLQFNKQNLIPQDWVKRRDIIVKIKFE